MSRESGDTIHANTVALRERASRCVTVHSPTPAGDIDRSLKALLEAQVSRYRRRAIGRAPARGRMTGNSWTRSVR